MTMTTTKTTTRKKPTTAKTPSTKKSVEKPVELMPNAFLHEILGAVVDQKTKQGKIDILRRFNENHLKAIFIWNFDDSVISVLPEGDVPYERNDNQATFDPKRGIPPHTTLRKDWNKLYNFVKGGNDAMNSLKKETMFINILSSLHPQEAEILCLVKDKKLQTKYNITKELVSEAYPDIQWGGRS